MPRAGPAAPSCQRAALRRFHPHGHFGVTPPAAPARTVPRRTSPHHGQAPDCRARPWRLADGCSPLLSLESTSQEMVIITWDKPEAVIPSQIPALPAEITNRTGRFRRTSAAPDILRRAGHPSLPASQDGGRRASATWPPTMVATSSARCTPPGPSRCGGRYLPAGAARRGHRKRGPGGGGLPAGRARRCLGSTASSNADVSVCRTPRGSRGSGTSARDRARPARVVRPLASIPGAVIQLRSGLLPDGVYRRDLGGCQLRSGTPRGDFIQPGHAEPLAPYTEPQVTNISSSTLSDSAQENSLVQVQEDSLRSGPKPWSATREARRYPFSRLPGNRG